MDNLGMHYAMDSTLAEGVLVLKGRRDSMNRRLDSIETLGAPAIQLRETDSTWDPVMNSLLQGVKDLSTWPIPELVLGRRQLLARSSGTVVTHLSPGEVREVADIANDMREIDFGAHYLPLALESVPEADCDIGHAWWCFGGLVSLFDEAARVGAHVFFRIER